MTIYGNKKTKRFHANTRGDQCRQGEILEANRVHFEGEDEAAAAAAAIAEGYRPCKACYPRQFRDIAK